MKKRKNARSRALGRVEIVPTPSGGATACRIDAATAPGAIFSIRDVQTCATHCGDRFFTTPALRAAALTPGNVAYGDGQGGAFFVTTEHARGDRRQRETTYTVRHFRPGVRRGRVGTCRVTTAGQGSRAHQTIDDAHRVARRLARQKRLP